MRLNYNWLYVPEANTNNKYYDEMQVMQKYIILKGYPTG